MWVEFRENGLATNFGGLSTPATGRIFPYQHLMVTSGLLGTMTIESISGHYLLVAKNAFAESELDFLSRKATGDLR